MARLTTDLAELARAYLAIPGIVPCTLLVAGYYALLLAARVSLWRLALLVFPGTLAHELAHFTVGWVMQAQPTQFSVWPRREGQHWQLGAVSFRGIGLLNGAFVALAPLLLLPVAWLCLMHVTLPCWQQEQWGGWLGSAYLTATLLFAAVPSTQDIRLGSASMLCYGILTTLVWWGWSTL